MEIICRKLRGQRGELGTKAIFMVLFLFLLIAICLEFALAWSLSNMVQGAVEDAVVVVGEDNLRPALDGLSESLPNTGTFAGDWSQLVRTEDVARVLRTTLHLTDMTRLAEGEKVYEIVGLQATFVSGEVGEDGVTLTFAVTARLCMPIKLGNGIFGEASLPIKTKAMFTAMF